MNKILLTGGSGFVGKAVYQSLLATNAYKVILPLRDRAFDSIPSENVVKISAIDAETDWKNILKDINVVIHSAARVHVMNETSKDPLTEFRRVNVEGTMNLARTAAAAGVRRFIFISSIKVNGEQTNSGQTYKADDIPAPVDPYGISKMEAELALKSLAKDTGMEVTIIRPVLVYGPGVKANFLNMMKCLNKSIPLPLGAINNKRSLVALDNLVDLIVTCIDHPNAANQIFMVSDGEDLSTTQLLRRLGTALAKTTHLLPVPMFFLEIGARLLGKSLIAQRLCGSLQVDINKTRDLLGWTPPITVDQALYKTANHFQNAIKK